MAYAKAYNNSRHKGNPFELGYLEGDISESGGKIAAIVSTMVVLALLLAIIIGQPRSTFLPRPPEAR